MIEKKDGTLPSTPDSEALAQTCQHLEARTAQAQAEVKSAFTRLTEALCSREKQLLRQIDVAHSQQLSLIQSRSGNLLSERIPHVTVQLDKENAIIDAISSLGLVGLTGGNLLVLEGDGSFLQRVEDYQDANQDHMSMFKPVPLDSSSSPMQETVIRFSHISLPPNALREDTDNLKNQNSQFEVDVVSPASKSENLESDDINCIGSSQKRQHPTQVQQWLKQLSAETETEPSIGEPKNFEPL
ncbi:putative GTP 3',8-cyclase [Frankliniella fusca]|uniref:GTP 3',8-cyclase n=1 Tax=Frankliniella fusca TaxID=407009 RepID=A0AAE1HSQ9_9NEOP|nr:putative GTP 3',8-cyclase [Frankliniella fusca]